MSVDPTVQPKNQHLDGGDRWEVGGTLNIDPAAGGALKIGGTTVAASAAEINALDGLTASVDELNILDGVTATAAELNILAGATLAVAELNQVDGIGGPAAAGVAAGYKVARGVHTQVAASDTVVTGLATVVAVVACFADAPTVKQLFCQASIGNQAGAPAAGSILLKTYKPTAVDNVTPTAATDFTDNINLAWLAIGT